MKIRVINKDINQEQFNKYSSIIATIVFNKCEDLKIDEKLTIYLKDKPTRNGINGSCYSRKKRYYMDLYSSLFDRKDDELELVIFHELVHLKDLISIDSKKTKYKSYKHTYKNIDNILIRQGFSWT